MKRTLLAFLALLLFAAPALAWGEKGHYIVNEVATYGVPADMPRFFHDAYPQLIYLAYEPDRWRNGGPSLQSINPPDHFLDYEYVAHLKLPPARYEYIDLLHSSGTLRREGITTEVPGYVLWKIAEVSETLVVEWRLWRAAETGSLDQRQSEENIVGLAGILGHYVGDSANPHHTTIHYNGWLAANPHGYANDCEIHSRFETQFVSRAMDVGDALPSLSPAKHETDYFAAALALVQESNRLVETLYRIDRDGGFGSQRGTPEARRFAASRLGRGASVLRDLWWSTWIDSATPGPQRR